LPLRIPDQRGVNRNAFVRFEIPILHILKARDVAVEKNKLRAFAVQGGMDIILLCHRGKPAIVEKPDGGGGKPDGSQFDLLVLTQPVDMLIETIVEQIISIAPARICVTDKIQT
jgi:hypothetical protein